MDALNLELNSLVDKAKAHNPWTVNHRAVKSLKYFRISYKLDDIRPYEYADKN